MVFQNVQLGNSKEPLKCSLQRSRLLGRVVSILKTGSTLKCHNILAFDIYNFLALGMYILELKALKKSNLQDSHRFFSKNLQHLDHCV